MLAFSDDMEPQIQAIARDAARDGAIDALLIDSRSPVGHGGTGTRYDWQAAQHLFRRVAPQLRLIAAGGLNPDNVAEAIRTLTPWGVDVATGVEAAPGRKDPARVAAFIRNARETFAQLEEPAACPLPTALNDRCPAERDTLELEADRMETLTQTRPGRFGDYGGRYVPETLMAALEELEAAYEQAKRDPIFRAELDSLLRDYAGRPTPLYFAQRLTERLGGAKIYLKREDLLHTGAHKINNCLGQGLLAQRMGKHRIIAETGAGQHGVATATICALLGMECVVYMGEEDMRRQELNVYRMRLLGAEVRGVSSGSKTLKDAINEAMRDWVTNVRTTHYLLGSVLGAHPYPTMVRDFHRITGEEIRRQILEKEGRLPNAIIACVGGGSNAMGAFYDFVRDPQVKLIGVEAGGRSTALGEHAARFSGGAPGVLQGTFSYVLQDEHGQVSLTHSVSAGLDYASVGPEHAAMHDSGRATYTSATDQQALDATVMLSRTEGIVPALESAHAVAEAIRLAPTSLPGRHFRRQRLRPRRQGHGHPRARTNLNGAEPSRHVAADSLHAFTSANGGRAGMSRSRARSLCTRSQSSRWRFVEIGASGAA